MDDDSGVLVRLSAYRRRPVPEAPPAGTAIEGDAELRARLAATVLELRRPDLEALAHWLFVRGRA